MSNVTYMTIDGLDWQLGETYVYVFAKYLVACPKDRRCQVGMGVNWFGEPRGEKIKFSGQKEVLVVLAGQLHFRVLDGKGPCRIGFVQSSNQSIGHTWDF